jgi:hypothetical protein
MFLNVVDKPEKAAIVPNARKHDQKTRIVKCLTSIRNYTIHYTADAHNGNGQCIVSAVASVIKNNAEHYDQAKEGGQCDGLR